MPTEKELIYDWNQIIEPDAPYPQVRVFDETLRDGIQCPSVTDPDIESKMEFIRLLDEIGVHHVDVGLPGAGQRAVEDCTLLVEMIRDEGLSILPACAARTHPNDIRPIIEISEKTGVPVEVMTFLGASPIRLYAENWEAELLEQRTRTAVSLGKSAGLRTTFVTEDTIRSTPDLLELLFTAAIEEGADGLCLCDTVGHATTQGTRSLIQFTRALISKLGSDADVDWHGHNDRGLSLANTLEAIRAGATRVHGTVLGVGERVGNTPLDQLMVNLKLLGAEVGDLSRLSDIVELTSSSCEVPVPVGYPVFGRDAFRTGTGVHAAAVIKAQQRGDDWLADRIYSGVPAAWFGRRQEIEVGHYSGMSNVKAWLISRGLEPLPALSEAILQHAKSTNRLLEEAELLAFIDRFQQA